MAANGCSNDYSPQAKNYTNDLISLDFRSSGFDNMLIW